MTKRILSIVLAVVMVVGMATTMLSASAYTYLNEASFDAYVSTNSLKVDAQMDDVYWQSEQVSNAYTNYARGTGTGFDAWQVATESGIYVYAVMDDTTVGSEYMIYNDNRGNVNAVSNADKLQYYFQFEYVTGTNWWGYFELNYYANNVDGETMVDDEITAAWGKAHSHARYKQAGSATSMDTNNIPAGIDYATKILRDSSGAEYGWVAEFFIPWNVAGNVPAEQYTAGTLPTTRVGIQCNNDDWSIDEGKTAYGDGWLYRQGYAYSNYTGTSWWNGDFNASPLIPLNFSTNGFAKYDVRLTSENIELDGKMDAEYLSSTMMYNEQGFIDKNAGGVKGTVNFKGYTVATLNGIYIFVDVEDETMNNIKNNDPANGEMVQVYLDWSPLGTAHSDPGVTWEETSSSRDYLNKVYGSWMGWFQADYNGNLSGSFDTSTTWLNDYGAKVAVEKYENPAWDGETASEQYTGYAIEFFIPYNDYMQYVVDTHNFADYHFSIGLQVNDDETYDDSENRTSIGYTYGGGSYWDKFEIIPEARLIPDANLPKHAAGTTVTDVALDGVNTDGEYDDAQVIKVNLAGSGNGDGDIYRVICDGNYVYVLMEMADNTPTYSSTKDSLGYKYHDYNDMYYARWNSSMCQWDGAYTSIHRESTGSNVAVAETAEGWTAEYRWALNASEKAAFAKGEFLFALSMQYLDGTATASGRQYKYDNDQGGVFYTAGGETYSAGFHKFVFAPYVAPRLSGANIALGQNITVNYYAVLGQSDTDAKLKVTMNDKVTYVGAQATAVDGQYKFAFKGIAPQCMGDNIEAELIVNGEVVATEAEYSVYENINNIEGDLTEEQFQLAADLLAYGAAAQIYAGYNVESLVNDDGYWSEYASEFSGIENEDRTYTAALADAKFTAAGVYHADTNKLYAKIYADDITKVTATVDGKAATIDFVDGSYIIYTDDINVTGFGEVHTFTITTAAGTQTLTYSVNAWCAQKYDSDSERGTAELAQALYNYGQSALALIAG